MLNYIFSNWRFRKGQFLLMVIGSVIISVGLSYLLGINQSQKLTVTEELQKRWKSSYDIVIRPEGSRGITENQSLLEPNYLNGLHGGISLKQYEKIKEMDEIEVAAPIAVVGYSYFNVFFDSIQDLEPGIYHYEWKEVANQGNQKQEVRKMDKYFSIGINAVDNDQSLYEKYGLSLPNKYIRTTLYQLVVGVDPIQEAKLVGLDDAINEGTYFDPTKHSVKIKDKGGRSIITEAPVIIRNETIIDNIHSFKIEKLDLPLNDEESIKNTLKEIESNGKEKYLDNVSSEVIYNETFTSEEAYEVIKNGILNKKYIENISPDADYPFVGKGSYVMYYPAPLEYASIQSPFPQKWSNAYEVIPQLSRPRLMDPEPALRGVQGIQTPALPSIEYVPIGTFESSKLSISKDPLNELPLETYRPQTVNLVLDSNGKPLNPIQTIVTTGQPTSFITPAPTILTTIEAAASLSGDKPPISAIRIKVKGVDQIGEDSQKKIDAVAQRIEAETGLITDITLGSSPQPVIVNVPGYGDEEALGWIEQPWISLGVATTIFKETKLGYNTVVMGLMSVAILYVFSTIYISSVSRRKEFAILLSLGWRSADLRKLLFLESALFSVISAILASLTLYITYWNMDKLLPIENLIVVIVSVISIYLIAALFSAIRIRSIKTNGTINKGEISTKGSRVVPTCNVFLIGVNNFCSKWPRNSLSIIAIVIPTILLSLFMYITFYLKGVFYTSWLGEFIAVKIENIHYISMAIAALLAVLISMQMIWQNVLERQREIRIFQSLGWYNKAIRFTIYVEGLIVGFFASLIGLCGTIGIIFILFGEFPGKHLFLLFLIGVIPLVMGIIGSVLPAIITVNRNNSENKMRVSRILPKRAVYMVATSFGIATLFLVYNLVFHTDYTRNVDQTNYDEEVTVSSSEDKGENIRLASIFEPMIKAIEEEDIAAFLRFQNKENSFFYTEQKRWIEDVIFKRQQGFQIGFQIVGANVESDKKGEVFFKLMMVSPKGESATHFVNYQAILKENGWKLNDLPFKQTKDGKVVVKYTEENEEVANEMESIAQSVIQLYQAQYGWKSAEKIEIKLYSSVSQLAATIPYMSLSGWYEAKESIKLVVDPLVTREQTIAFLVHEISHKMLKDLTNDNASPLVQEGLAKWNELNAKMIQGKVQLDQKLVREHIQYMISNNINEPLTIDMLTGEDKLNNQQQYDIGVLFTQFLLERFGMEKYLAFSETLKDSPYVDKRSTHKVDITNRLTLEALNEIYGDTNQLIVDFHEFYN